MQLRPYQEEAKTAIFREWEQGNSRTLLVLPTGCHAKGQRVLTADGKSRKAEDVRVGDFLVGADSKPRLVLHTVSGTDTLYEITPVKGKPFTVTGDHKLTLVRTNEKACPLYPCQAHGGEVIDVTVSEWLTWSKWKKHLHKLIRADEMTFPFARVEPDTIPAYFLGILLGDGGLTQNINVTTPDSEVVQELERYAAHYGMHLRAEPAGQANVYHFVQNDSYSHGNVLRDALKKLKLTGKGSGSKFIPDAYKTGSVTARREILAGLLDSDGSLTVNGYDYISKSKQLSEDVAFVARSLGLAAYVTECEKVNQYGFRGTYYRVSVSGECSKIPCRVKRKQSGKRQQKKSVLRTGFSVKCVGQGEYYGFTVDGDNRYLLDDFTITHNCGKTIVFAKVAEDCVRSGKRVLILAHRGELLEQASDKIQKACGLICSVEKAEQTCLGSWNRITVGSVQTLMREKRLSQFTENYFDNIIIDEAHHCLSDSYQRVLDHFSAADMLGVTATPDRGDMRDLGQYFNSLAYEYTLPQAIKEGYLSPIKALTVPLKLDLTGVQMQNGDYKAADIDSALDPYLDQIADEMIANASDRKTVVFLPLINTSRKFRDILLSKGVRAAEVNGNSPDRAEILADFDNGKYQVLCNSMLLTEGWDCPSVDCVVVLRPTKIRSLYSQMIGRGTRLYPGKSDLLILDFLWHTERHELCRPACLIAKTAEVMEKMTENIAEAGCPVDIEEAEVRASEDVVAQREEALAKQLAEMRHRSKKLVDPLQFEMSIQDEDLISYVPSFGWEMEPPTSKQTETLEKWGILPDTIDNKGKASMLLDRLFKRRHLGLSTPKQIRFLEAKGFQHVGSWSFVCANAMISRIQDNGWQVPYNIDPATYIGH